MARFATAERFGVGVTEQAFSKPPAGGGQAVSRIVLGMETTQTTPTPDTATRSRHDDIPDLGPATSQFDANTVPDEARVGAFAERLVADAASTSTTLMTIIGDRLGLYETLSGAGPLGAEEFAQVSGFNARLVTEWLAAQTVAGYVMYDPDELTYELPVEHAAVLSDPASPAYIVAATAIVGGLFQTLDDLERAFRGDGGIEIYDAMDEYARFGVERFFRTSYTHELASVWFCAVRGLTERMERGVRVADVGSGHGASTIAMATAWPRSTVVGFDAHPPSVTVARSRAIEVGNPSNLAFHVADAAYIGPGPFDVVTFFDSLHDMGDPVAALRQARSVLSDDGIVVVVEPWSVDHLEDAIGDPRTRLAFGISTAMCTPGSLAQPGAYGLGTQGGPTRRLELMAQAGFREPAVVADTGFNLVFAARR
ncbi:MAG: methyltransferase domain-containing protein [Ornithinimicrobium sp.]